MTLVQRRVLLRGLAGSLALAVVGCSGAPIEALPRRLEHSPVSLTQGRWAPTVVQFRPDSRGFIVRSYGLPSEAHPVYWALPDLAHRPLRDPKRAKLLNQDVVFSPDSSLVAAATETGVAIFKTGTAESLWGSYTLRPLAGALPLAFDDQSDHLAVATSNSVALVRVDPSAEWVVLPPESAGDWGFTKSRGPENAVPRALTGGCFTQLSHR